MKMLGFINCFILQFLFVRLTVCRELTRHSTPHPIVKKWYSIMFFVLPFTGWSGPYKPLGRIKYMRITKKRPVYY